ncbi:hypothetical protein NDU88_003725 [Pleurodeles waltl]|uniref:Uncharacterized protein n=1 Tax=Pleurodeles waltl TaxID=8319 RepID=A0AAV7RG25_PLEWA|nr:hypothetical protein NDU88_003725 [Pleurodeles waltl]
MLVLGARQGGRPGNPEGNQEGSGGSGGQRGGERAQIAPPAALVRSGGVRAQAPPPRITSWHHKENLESFSGVSLVAISHKTIPKLLTVGILLVGGGVKQLQQRGKGEGRLCWAQEPRVYSRSDEPPLAPCRSAYRWLPRSFTNSPYALLLLAPTVAAAAGGLPDVLSWLSGDSGCCCLPLPLGIQSAAGAVGNRVLAFSHTRCEPPGRGVWCVFVRCVDNLSSKSLAHRPQRSTRFQNCPGDRY